MRARKFFSALVISGCVLVSAGACTSPDELPGNYMCHIERLPGPKGFVELIQEFKNFTLEEAIEAYKEVVKKEFPGDQATLKQIKCERQPDTRKNDNFWGCPSKDDPGTGGCPETSGGFGGFDPGLDKENDNAE